MRARLKGYRTILINGAVAAAAVVVEVLLPLGSALVGMPEAREIIPAGAWPWIVVGVNMANMALRAVTDTPVGKAEK